MYLNKPQTTQLVLRQSETSPPLKCSVWDRAVAELLTVSRWVRWCLARSLELLKAFWQPGCWQRYGFSPVWLLRWIFRFSRRENALLQPSNCGQEMTAQTTVRQQEINLENFISKETMWRTCLVYVHFSEASKLLSRGCCRKAHFSERQQHEWNCTCLEFVVQDGETAEKLVCAVQRH